MELVDAIWVQDPGRPILLNFGPTVRTWHVQDKYAPTYPRTLCGLQITTRGPRAWTKFRKSSPTSLKNTSAVAERICYECEQANLPR
jgi:hypothetical protein